MNAHVLFKRSLMAYLTRVYDVAANGVQMMPTCTVERCRIATDEAGARCPSQSGSIKHHNNAMQERKKKKNEKGGKAKDDTE